MRTHVVLFLLFPALAFGQAKSSGENIPWIFGGGKDYNGTVLSVSHNYSVIYSRDSCDITCVDGKGYLEWDMDLRNFSCELIFFAKIPGKKIKGYDLYFQLKDKTAFLLKSKNGKIKLLTKEDIDKYSSKK